MPEIQDFSEFRVKPPTKRTSQINESQKTYTTVPTSGVKRDYMEREARNAALGLAGEKLILEYEDFRLRQTCKKTLANKIEHISDTQGDGLGYDILSFEESGKERFIEVKTTAFAKEMPFFASRNEVTSPKPGRTSSTFIDCLILERHPNCLSCRAISKSTAPFIL